MCSLECGIDNSRDPKMEKTVLFDGSVGNWELVLDRGDGCGLDFGRAAAALTTFLTDSATSRTMAMVRGVAEVMKGEHIIIQEKLWIQCYHIYTCMTGQTLKQP